MNAPPADYLEFESQSENADAGAAAAVLESVAETLREAPNGYRCDFALTIEERDGGGR